MLHWVRCSIFWLLYKFGVRFLIYNYWYLLYFWDWKTWQIFHFIFLFWNSKTRYIDSDFGILWLNIFIITIHSIIYITFVFLLHSWSLVQIEFILWLQWIELWLLITRRYVRWINWYNRDYIVLDYFFTIN